MDDRAIDMLLDIARIQNRLLLQRIDILERTKKELPSPKKGFFKKSNPAYQERAELLYQLNNLKGQINALLNASDKLYWWNIAWEELEEAIADDLSEIRENGVWRFEYDYEALRHNDIVFLFLHESGHCSQFDTSSVSYDYDAMNISDYERNKVLQNYDDGVRENENDFLAWNSNNLVYSELTGRTFTAKDYIESVDHDFWRSHYRNELEKSMHDIRSSNTTYVVSRSMHYKAVYLIGKYITNKQGTDLLGCEFCPYTLNYVEGNVPPEFIHNRQQRHTLCTVSAYIAYQSDILKAPLSYFGNHFIEPENDLFSAACYASLFTIIADRLCRN